MENSDPKLNELISDLSEPARSTVAAIVLLQKIPNQILILKKNIITHFLKSTHIETDDSHEKSRSSSRS
jgi:hypothetical protein